VRSLLIFLCGCLLPLLALADDAQSVSLQLVEGMYQPGDVIELHAEMRRAEYAEFELHVPADAQLHFVAHTRGPVGYVEGVYVQSVLLLLQPMNAGEFKLSEITATLEEGGVSTEVALPSVQFTVASYAAEDSSKALAALTNAALMTPKASVLLFAIVAGLVVLILVVWILLRKPKPAVVEVAETVSLSDLVVVLAAGEPAVALIERLLGSTEVSMSPRLREHLEAAAYANRINTADLLRALKEEVLR
jgi:xanthosine utilization system XapX-like protein